MHLECTHLHHRQTMAKISKVGHVSLFWKHAIFIFTEKQISRLYTQDKEPHPTIAEITGIAITLLEEDQGRYV
ncbi:MAG: hypothetical protein U9N54_02105 [candidate division Zixibacteria bacterium]|nr:hypothetical protein [candidate division Zixibacteria bacterium]